MLTSCQHLDMRDNQSYDHAIVGKNGKGFVWKQSGIYVTKSFAIILSAFF